jgi:hypothetical protein
MTIRSLAVVVVAALSAVDCHVYVREPYAYQPAPPPPQPRVVVRPVAPAPLPQPAPPQPAPPQPPLPEPPRRVARRTVAPPTVAVETTSTEIAPSASIASIPPATSTPAPSATTYVPAACLDTGATPVGDCSAIKLPDATCGHSSAARPKCDAYKTYFDAKIAAIAVSCVTSLSSRQLCDASQPLLCAKTALAQACADPSVVQLCQIAATSCKITPGECSALLSGLNDGGQQAIAECVAQGCPTGLGGCIDGLAKTAH